MQTATLNTPLYPWPPAPQATLHRGKQVQIVAHRGYALEGFIGPVRTSVIEVDTAFGTERFETFDHWLK